MVIIENETIEGAHNSIVIEDAERVVIAGCRLLSSESGSVWLVNCGDVTFVDNLVDGAGNMNEHKSDCVMIHQIGNLLMERNIFRHAAHAGVVMIKSRGRTGKRVFRRNRFEQMFGSHLIIKEHYDGVLIEENWFEDAMTAANATPGSMRPPPDGHGSARPHAILQLSGDRHVFRGNVGRRSGIGLLISSGGDQTCSNCIFEDNVLVGFEGHAIEVQAAGGADTLSGNAFRGNRIWGSIHLALPGADGQLYGNMFSGNEQGGGALEITPGGVATITDADHRYPDAFQGNRILFVMPAPEAPSIPSQPAPPAPAPVPAPPLPPADTVGTNPEFARALLDETNKLRAVRGLYAFSWHNGLARVAQAFCEQLVAAHVYASADPHRGPDGKYTWERIGSVFPGASPANSSENLANNYPTAESVVNGWANHPGHSENIYSTHWRLMGGGYAYSPQGLHPAIVWCQDFHAGESGTPSPGPTPVPVPPPTPTPPPPSVPPRGPNPDRYRPRRRLR